MLRGNGKSFTIEDWLINTVPAALLAVIAPGIPVAASSFDLQVCCRYRGAHDCCR